MPTSKSAVFTSTHWSLVLTAAKRSGSEAEAALATLCQTYWPAVYAFILRQTTDLHEAQDLTQAFFARLLEKNLAAKAKSSRGRFRSFLLAAVRNFLNNERDKARTIKRGGGRGLVSFDFPREGSQRSLEPVDTLTPERYFERQWALTMLDHVMAGLREDYAKAGKEAQFEQLKATLVGADVPTFAIAEALGMTTNAVKVAAHRLRKRYKERLRFEVAQTLSATDAIDDEIRRLFAALQG